MSDDTTSRHQIESLGVALFKNDFWIEINCNEMMYTDRRTEPQLRKLPTISYPINGSNCLRSVKWIVSVSHIKIRAHCFSDELLTISNLAINTFNFCGAFSLACPMLRLCTFPFVCQTMQKQGDTRKALVDSSLSFECENDHRKSRWRRKTEAKINVYLGIYSEPSASSSSFAAVPTMADKDESRTYNCYSSLESAT